MNMNTSRNGRGAPFMILTVPALVRCAFCVTAPEADAADATVTTADELINALQGASSGDTITVTGDVVFSQSIDAGGNGATIVVASSGSIEISGGVNFILNVDHILVVSGGYVCVDNLSSLSTATGGDVAVNSEYTFRDNDNNLWYESLSPGWGENGELSEENSIEEDDGSGTDYRPALVIVVVVVAAIAVALWVSRRGA